MKNYYQILGVLDDAEDVVIRAAYKALAQKYHPDRWKGSQADATARMSEINRAYETLVDPVKRAKYDETIDRSSYEEDQDQNINEEELISDLDEMWNKVLEFLPDLKYLSNNLSKISKSLEYAFKLTLLETKRFNEGDKIAHSLEDAYLTKYFGTNKEIHSFAKQLIFAGKRIDAKALNDAVVLLGSSVEPKIIIRKIQGDLTSNEVGMSKLQMAELLLEVKSIRCADDFMKAVGAEVKSLGFWGNQVEVLYNGVAMKMSLPEYIEYASGLAKNILGRA